MAQTTATNLIKQYEEMKKKHPDAILLFRVGDFYETFSEDAVAASEILGITLTRRADGKAQSVELAGFPHHALDTYLPKLVRAGKRVAICEQLKDGTQNRVEEVAPAKEEPAGQEPAKEEPPVTGKPVRAIREINCTFGPGQMRDLGEPVAYFSLEIPKALRHIGKLTTAAMAQLSAVCLEPETGKMVASDRYILYSADVECSGAWPGERNGSPFRCYIDPKAIAHLAGKTVDVAVWEDERGRHKMTACEADGVLTQYQITGQTFPDWRKAMPQSHPASVSIMPSELKPLRDFLKANMGKTKKERECRTVAIQTDRDADRLTVTVEDRDYAGGRDAVATETFRLEGNAGWHIRQVYRVDLFYYSVQEDFRGLIYIDGKRPSKFMGEMRQSALMPMRGCGEEKTYCVRDLSEISKD